MKMHLLSGGRLRMARRVYYPGAAEGETMELPVSCALFRHAQGAAVFDTGCHPDAATRWGRWADYSPPIFAPGETLVSQLPLAGLGADDIDLVICSHFHYDHCGCNAFFRRATVICHAKELEAARAANADRMGYIAADWDAGLPLQAVAGQHDVFGDGRLTLIPLPGHTPGSLGAHAVLDGGGAVFLASDAAPVAACLEHRYAPANTVDKAQFLASLDEIARLQRDGATVLFGHDDAQWRGVRKGSDAYS